MSVNGVNNNATRELPENGNPPPAANNSDNSMSNMFMKLLVAQVQNQNPLNPTDGTEYVAQLAQMAQVQSMENMSVMMQNNAVLMDNLQVLSTASLVGQEVMVRSDKVTLSDQEVKGRLTLDHADDNVTVILKDSAGVQHKIELGKQDKGEVNFTIDPEKLDLAPGEYSLSVVTSAADDKGAKVPIELAGVVTNVRIPVDGSGMMIALDGLGEVPFYQLSQIGSKKLEQNSRV